MSLPALKRLTILPLSALMAMGLAGLHPARAEVKSASAHGFEVAGTQSIDAPPERVWQVLTAPDTWWSREHRWFKNSQLHLDLTPGGCWCETGQEGQLARHLQTVMVDPGSQLVLRGELGPLQGQGVSGALSFQLKPEGEGTQVLWTYGVGGYVTGGLENWAAPVNLVLSQQMDRLKQEAETPPAP